VGRGALGVALVLLVAPPDCRSCPPPLAHSPALVFLSHSIRSPPADKRENQVRAPVENVRTGEKQKRRHGPVCGYVLYVVIRIVDDTRSQSEKGQGAGAV
jgi:hypothetical protein